MSCTAAILLCAAACSLDTSAASFAPGRDRESGRVPSVSGPNASGTGGSGAAAAGGSFGNPGSPGAAGTRAVPNPPAAGSDSNCAEGVANTTPVTPIVWLVVDGSSSMYEPFEGVDTRWQTLRSTLMDPGGVVASLQSVARIGLVIYSGGAALLGGECVNLVTVQPALDNYATLDAMYPLNPIGTGTPTDRALDHVVTNLPVTNSGAGTLDAEVDPVYVVLATDGAPNDSCSGGFGDDGAVEQLVVDVTARGTQMGMEMFVISLAGDDLQLQSHLQDVAAATSRQVPPFVPATRDELVLTFRDIVGGATCQVALDGMVSAGQQCRGQVLLNGSPLTCDSDNGWRMTDPRTVQLTGSACTDFQTSRSQVHASFPCDAFSPD